MNRIIGIGLVALCTLFVVALCGVTVFYLSHDMRLSLLRGDEDLFALYCILAATAIAVTGIMIYAAMGFTEDEVKVTHWQR